MTYTVYSDEEAYDFFELKWILKRAVKIGGPVMWIWYDAVKQIYMSKHVHD